MTIHLDTTERAGLSLAEIEELVAKRNALRMASFRQKANLERAFCELHTACKPVENEPPVRGALHRALYILLGFAVAGFIAMPVAAKSSTPDGFLIYCALVGAVALVGTVLGAVCRFRR